MSGDWVVRWPGATRTSLIVARRRVGRRRPGRFSVRAALSRRRKTCIDSTMQLRWIVSCSPKTGCAWRPLTVRLVPTHSSGMGGSSDALRMGSKSEALRLVDLVSMRCSVESSIKAWWSSSWPTGLEARSFRSCPSVEGFSTYCSRVVWSRLTKRFLITRLEREVPNGHRENPGSCNGFG